MLLLIGSAAAAPGDLDPTFGMGGMAQVGIGSVAMAEDIALEPDGKIVLAGFASDQFGLARFNSDGSVDGGFGTGGTVAGPGGTAYAVAIQADGKILAAGSNGSMAVVRYTSSGDLDSTFGNGGIVTGPSGEARDIAVQADGRIVVAGKDSAHFLILRFDPSGSPDSSFGTNGVVRTRIGTSSEAWAIALQGDGKIVVAGSSSGPNGNAMTLVRYNPSGALDPTFGASGVATARASQATAVVVQSDGRIVAAGNADRRLAVVRFQHDGRLDASFGSGGLTTVGNGGLEIAWDLALQSNGQIVVAGGDTTAFTLVRLGASGELDPFFADGGISRVSLGFWSEARGVAIDPDGRIVAAGFAFGTGETHFAVARFRVTSPTTITAQEVVVRYGGELGLAGIAADPQPGAEVQILSRGCYASRTTRPRTTRQTGDGHWATYVTPSTKTSYRAEILGDRSVPVEVQVRPRVTLRRLTRSRVQVRVLFGHELGGETITLQRLRPASGWVDTRIGALREIGRTKAGVVSGATFKARRLSGPVRALLRQSNPYACYGEAASRPIRR